MVCLDVFVPLTTIKIVPAHCDWARHQFMSGWQPRPQVPFGHNRPQHQYSRDDESWPTAGEQGDEYDPQPQQGSARFHNVGNVGNVGVGYNAPAGHGDGASFPGPAESTAYAFNETSTAYRTQNTPDKVV